MCGIAGGVNFSMNAESVIAKMGHRGPDGNGIFNHSNVTLIHLRLAILDLVGGVQPMFLENRYVIIFNGEIYNHLDVRKQLQLTCKTNSDTETILLAYEKVGSKCLNYFDGMFALCIYDSEDQTLFFARDRAGKKPLYWYNDGEKFVFASELNFLRSLLPLQINTDAIPFYLRLGAGWKGQTPYLNVQELEPGTWLLLQVNTLTSRKETWWQIGNYYSRVNNQITEAEALEKTEGFFKRAIETRLESSDLEVGSFLSGGIDSGLVTSVAAQMRSGLRTFTICFDGAFNEAPLARLVAEKYNTRHTEINISLSGLKDDIEKIISQFGEPFYDSSAIPSWYVSRAARQHLTVILNGDGADELFAGYRRHALFAKYNFFKTPGAVRSLAAMAGSILPPGHDKKSVYNYLYRLLFLSSRKSADVFVASGSDIFEGYESNFMMAQDSYRKEMDILDRWIADNKGTGLQQLLELDFTITLPCDFLVKMDIATMAHSLEGRSPFLAKDLLEYIPALPDNLKIRGNTTKYLLRKIAEKYLPEALWNQPKRGFEVPLKNWVNNDLKDIIFDYLGNPNAYYKGFVSKDYVHRLLENQVRISEEKRAKQLYTLFCLEVWYHKNYLN